jgi:hypothetical protein
MHRSIVVATAAVAALATVFACGGATSSLGTDGGTGKDGSASSSGSGSSGSGSSGSASGSGGASSSGVSSSSGGSSSGTTSSSGSSSGEVPLNHRTSDAECQTVPPPGQCPINGDPNLACTDDAECSDGTNGRCVTSGGPVEECECTYDACFHDTACNTGELCACHGSPYTGNFGNACVQANCRVDSDCGPGGYCSPSADPNSCAGGLLGYYCHTPKDLCVNDADCSPSGGPQVCAYQNGFWQCEPEQECP